MPPILWLIWRSNLSVSANVALGDNAPDESAPNPQQSDQPIQTVTPVFMTANAPTDLPPSAPSESQQYVSQAQSLLSLSGQADASIANLASVGFALTSFLPSPNTQEM